MAKVPGTYSHDREIAVTLDALYAELPLLECRGECSRSCGPVVMGRVEWKRITKRLGFAPPATPDLTCPMLKDDRCSVYDLRPMLCRLWGLVESMPCPWGCVPSRYLTDAEGRDFLLRVELAECVDPRQRAEIERLRLQNT